MPGLDGLSPDSLMKQAATVKTMLDNQGLTPEFVAPRLWFDPRTVDGGYTSNSAADRAYAWDRTKKAIDIARAIVDVAASTYMTGQVVAIDGGMTLR